MKTIPEINFEEVSGQQGNLGLITLNRSQVLNSLNHDMFIALGENLAEWEKKSSIKAVVICASEGRAFCAGGDIRAIYETKKQGNTSLDHFFRDEYRMNKRIYHFPKPYIALLDGITMGGGVGISIHGSHRIGTEKLVFAMPETTIGFYPDVGSTYHLARMPSHVGYYLGLTGARLSDADCLALGIIQFSVDRESFPKIIDTLRNSAIPSKESVTELLKTFAKPTPAAEILNHKSQIEKCFKQRTVEEILTALENENDEWCQKTAELLKTKSPTSLKVTLKAIQEASKLSFDASIKMEYTITCHFVEGHDFFEGIRALVIDKDQKPKWNPASLAQVTEEEVASYFTPVAQELV